MQRLSLPSSSPAYREEKKSEALAKLITKFRHEISAGLSHLFIDLPIDPKKLKELVADIVKAVGGQLRPNHDLYNLQEYIQHPEVALKLEEAEATQIKIGEAQQMIADYIEEQLATAAKACKPATTLEELGWDSLSISLNLGFSENAQKTFKTDKTRQADVVPNYFLSTEERIFDATVIPYPIKVDLKIDLTAKIKEQATKTVLLATPPKVKNSPENYRFLDQFVENLTTSTKTYELAEQNAASLVLPKTEFKNATAVTKSLITYRIFYTLFKDKQIELKELALTPELAEVITRPPILHSIKDQASFLRALQYTMAEVRILENPVFAKELADGTRDFDRDFKGVTPQQSFNLIFVATHQLDLIPFEAAKNLTPAVIHLLSEKSYREFFKKLKFQFTDIEKITEQHNEILLDPKIIHLIDNNILSVTRAMHLLPQQKIIVCHAFINQLLTKRVINLTQAFKLSPETIALIDKNPYLQQMLYNGAMKIDEVNLNSIQFWKKYFNKRIHAIEMGLPYSVDKKIDNFHAIAQEVEKIAALFPEENLLNDLIKVMLERMKFRLSSELQKCESEVPTVYLEILSILKHKEDSDQYLETLDQVILAANHTRITLPRSLFLERGEKRVRSLYSDFFEKPSITSMPGAKRFCDQIYGLSAFTKIAIEEDYTHSFAQPEGTSKKRKFG